MWDAYEQMRRKIKKPMTPRARELVVIELEKLRVEGQDAVAMLEQSNRNDWRSVPPRRQVAPEGHSGAVGSSVVDIEHWWRTDQGVKWKGEEMSMPRREGESSVIYQARVYDAAGDGPWMEDGNATVQTDRRRDPPPEGVR